MGIISVLFGNKKPDFKGLVNQGAIIVDVRSPHEFASGHIEGSINMPLDTIVSKTASLTKMGKPVITVCRSGARSRLALGILKSAEIETVNGGAWDVLKQKIQ